MATSNTRVKINEELQNKEVEPEKSLDDAVESNDGSKGEVASEGVGVDEQEGAVAVEDMDPDEELWPNGPTAQDIVDWKEEYGDVYVTSVTYDHHIVWRTLNRAEYKAHVRNMEQLTQSGKLTQADAGMFNEELLAEMCILFPPYTRANAAAEMAGVPSIIAQEVMEASGFVALDVRQL